MFVRTGTVLEEEEEEERGGEGRRVRVGLRVPGLQTRFSCWCEELISVRIYAFVHVRGAGGRRVRMLLFFRRHDAS